MLRELDYQKRVLETLDAYLDVLGDEKGKADKVAALVAEQPDLGIELPDYAKKAWERMGATGTLPTSRAAIPFSPRADGVGRTVPNVVFKIPTGGGKTFLAANALSRIFGRFLNRNTGFVLWIVPNEAIYSQTLKRLKDRQDPYRQVLDRAAAGRVKIMEKSDRLDARDVEGQLCIMLLMLQSANRETKDTLKMFRDRGDVAGFTPPEGDQKAHTELIKAVGNLDCYDDLFPMVKDSLGNALRIIRPVVVLDEGHKAVSDLAFKTLYGFNPRFVLELTATPHDVQPRGGNDPREGRYSNVLVEVTGLELDREGMIKMPLNLIPKQGTDWKSTLNESLKQLDFLDAKAAELRADSGRYIRPIMLVQVERTGKDQRNAEFIHSDDVKEWLLTAGFDEAEIAIKTAETNDLSQPENLDLLSPTNRVRAIITKSALQEGWDCPFAYVLCSLAASSNLKAMTQLVGRILRQPAALKTGVAELDECYVVTHHVGTGDVVAAIKDGGVQKIAVFMRRILLAAMMLAPSAASAEMFDHNGSLMIVNYDWSDIRYDTPGDRMGSLVSPGDPAFTGHIERRGKIEGTAYVYKKGCNFIFYKVSGRYDHAVPGYVLTGAAPIRAKKGCGIVGYTMKSPNARLVFVDIVEKEKREQDGYAKAVYEDESDPNWMDGFNDPTAKK